MLVLLTLLITSLAISCLESSPTEEDAETHYRVIAGVVETTTTVRLEDDTVCTYSNLDLAIGEEYVFVVEVNGECIVRSAVEIIK